MMGVIGNLLIFCREGGRFMGKIKLILKKYFVCLGYGGYSMKLHEGGMSDI
jgi:hypothetical protein